MRRIRTLLYDERVWILLRESELTNHIRARTLLCLSVAGTLTEKLLASSHARPPWRLFLCVGQPELASALKQWPACLFDDWSRQFMQANDIETEAARMKLALHMMMIFMNTDRLEIGNAHIRRFVKRRVQCTQIDTEDVSTKWMGHQVRGNQPPRVPAEVPVEANGGEDDAHPSTFVGGGGGPWRAFMRKMGSNDAKEVSRLYNLAKANVGDEVFAECLQEGAEATMRRRLTNGAVSFGPKASVVARETASLQIQARVAQAAGLDAVAIDGLMADVRLHDYPLDEALDMATKMQRQLVRASTNSERAADKCIAEFERANTSNWNAELAALAPGVAAASSGSLVAEPSPIPGALVFRLQDAPAVADASELVEYCRGMSLHHTYLLDALDKQWGALHQTVSDDAEDSKDSSPEDEAIRQSQCWLVGTCVCGAQGQAIRQLRARLLRFLKDAHPVRSAAHENLCQGRVFLKFEASVAGDDDGGLAEFWGIDSDDMFVQVAHINFSPYAPMLQPMRWPTDEDRASACAAANEITLKVTHAICVVPVNSPFPFQLLDEPT